nr:immunoglobulin light chain junction region [Macaca mulatta]MPO03469.1 immunoglobulin light chain junction region [Macaca mulatta]MPO03608.1 immunoglobulin light chain junction region [Macaca mulatta]MPO04136.1 immunoglobulin light chain junction region [Macaca mulatta]MPO04510.1 immunoglobulin light chain junction region [Macaca mulatta]
CSSYADINVLF